MFCFPKLKWCTCVFTRGLFAIPFLPVISLLRRLNLIIRRHTLPQTLSPCSTRNIGSHLKQVSRARPRRGGVLRRDTLCRLRLLRPRQSLPGLEQIHMRTLARNRSVWIGRRGGSYCSRRIGVRIPKHRDIYWNGIDGPTVVASLGLCSPNEAPLRLVWI